MSHLAEVPAPTLTDASPRRAGARVIHRIIQNRAYRSAYQPIVDLSTSTIEGFECLTRFDASGDRSPDTWFLEAAEAGLGDRLEADTIGCAIRALRILPPGLYLSVNASPGAVLTGAILPIFERIDPRRIVLELTEHRPVENYAALNEALGPLRARGLRVAVDDVGAGHADLQHLIHLRPDVVKLDISLTRGLIGSEAIHALISGLVGFAHAIESRVVAEGIETPAQLHALKALGIDAGQGFFLGAPIGVRR